MRAVLLSLLAFSLATAEPQPTAKLSVKTLTAQMKFTTDELIVRPGQAVELTFDNGDDLPHNLVICKPDTDVVTMTMKQMENAPEALKRNWLPDDPAILFHTKMLNPHESDTLRFTAPTQVGDYPFVCTFPGHALTMRGKVIVRPLGEKLSDLRFALYLGSWKNLPDFSKLTPHREGSVPDNLIQLKLDDYKNEFGIVFNGTITAPRKGLYEFVITSDDGSRLFIDDKEVAEHDGIHPAGSPQTGRVKLEPGPHRYRLEYFQAAGNLEIGAAWSGPGFDLTPLSKSIPDQWQGGVGKKNKKNDWSPIVLTPSTEPIVYRNFIAGVGNRGIGVGFPGALNMAWSAGSFNLVQMWQGAFMDAGRHWTNRGGGHQPAAGFNVIKPANELSPPFAVLAQPTDAWPQADAQLHAEGYAWKGYILDAKRVPTFRYTWRGVEIEDRVEPKDKTFVRTIKIARSLPAGAQLLLSQNAKIEAKGDAFLCSDGPQTAYLVSTPGATLVAGKLLLNATSGTITVTYAWPN